MKDCSCVSAYQALDEVLRSADCMRCRDCCKFIPEHRIYAPLFTPESHERVLERFAGRDIRFHPFGRLWQIELLPIADDPAGRSACPFYDQVTALCEIYDERPFDCATWPFYIMRCEGRVVIAVSPGCPTVAATDLEFLRTQARERIGPCMVAEARRYPDLIPDYYDEAVVLLDVTDQMDTPDS